MPGNDRAGMVIQPRDEHLLRELGAMRIIDREQAKVVAGFRSTRRANARLLALVRAGLLKRFFQGTEAGGKKALYTLSFKGARLLGVLNIVLHHRDDELIVTNFFIAHQMAVNEIFCAVKYRTIPVQGSQFRRWLGFTKPISQGNPLIPDGYWEVSTSQGVVAAFLEVDLGNEGAAVWKKKIGNYLRYAASGDFEERFGQGRFRVLVVANSERRLELIRKVVRGFTDKIFWFSTLGAIRREGLWAAVWFRATEGAVGALL
jgi:Replication-relaxation